MTERDMLIDQLTEVNELTQEVLKLGKLGTDLNRYIAKKSGLQSYTLEGCNKVKAFEKQYRDKKFLKDYYEHVVNEDIIRENNLHKHSINYKKKATRPVVDDAGKPNEIKPQERPGKKPKIRISWSAWAGAFGGVVFGALDIFVLIACIVNFINDKNTMLAVFLLFLEGILLVPLSIHYYKKVLSTSYGSKDVITSIRMDFEFYKQELFMYEHYDEYLAQIAEENKKALDEYNKDLEQSKKELHNWRFQNRLKIEEVEEQYNELFKKWDELPNIMIRILESDDVISCAYLSRLPEIINLLKLGRADTIKEAINLCLSEETYSEREDKGYIQSILLKPYFDSYKDVFAKYDEQRKQ